MDNRLEEIARKYGLLQDIHDSAQNIEHIRQWNDSVLKALAEAYELQVVDYKDEA